MLTKAIVFFNRIRGIANKCASGAGNRYGLPYLLVGPKMGEGKSMRTTSVHVARIATKGPGDVSGLLSLIGSGRIAPKSIVAILGKTEGNGGVNDFTREYAVSVLSAALAPYVDLPPHRVEQRIAFVMSGGTEGVLSPHITVFTRNGVANRGSEAVSGKRLSIGMAQTRDFLPEELGRGAQIRETARGSKRCVKQSREMCAAGHPGQPSAG